MITLSVLVGTEAEPRELKGDVLSIGRSRFNDVSLGHRKVSRLHAKIRGQGGEIRIFDLRSGNGTLLNGRKIAEETLVAGDRIGIGPFELIVLNADLQAADGESSKDPLNTTAMLRSVPV